ncbi:MAG TPA: NYN domain-containing protein [Rhodospirillales bacterium]|nr:NYN domain-containing protein [Rhodospirillales bacterium]
MTEEPIHHCEPYERVALFIDGANLYQAARALGFDIDYRRLLTNFSTDCRLLRAYYYTALLDEQEYSPIRPLVDWLEYNGYTMVTKPLKEYAQPLGRRKFKGNMDVEITVDAMEVSAHVDHVVLFSGDGDFRRLIEALQRRGIRVTVVSTIRTQPPMVADELRRQADFFLDLADLRPAIERNHSRTSTGNSVPVAEDYDDEDYEDEEDETPSYHGG